MNVRVGRYIIKYEDQPYFRHAPWTNLYIGRLSKTNLKLKNYNSYTYIRTAQIENLKISRKSLDVSEVFASTTDHAMIAKVANILAGIEILSERKHLGKEAELFKSVLVDSISRAIGFRHYHLDKDEIEALNKEMRKYISISELKQKYKEGEEITKYLEEHSNEKPMCDCDNGEKYFE